jgi:hypothetical protein
MLRKSMFLEPCRLGVFILLLSNLSISAADFPTFKEKKSGVLIEFVVSEFGRFNNSNILKTLGQECIDSAGVTITKESNLLVMPAYQTGNEISIIFRGIDRFGNKFVRNGFTCEFDPALRKVIKVGDLK